MELSHLHLGFKDFPGASAWFTEVAGVAPDFRNDKLAYHRFGGVIVVLEQADADTTVTLAVKSGHVDRDCAALAAKGAAVIQAPIDQKWGVRSAYLKGPGAVTIELEQPTSKNGEGRPLAKLISTFATATWRGGFDGAGDVRSGAAVIGGGADAGTGIGIARGTFVGPAAAVGASRGGISTRISLPRELGGRGEDATPEDLFLAALGSCYLITLGIILEKAKLPYESLRLDAELRTEGGALATIMEAVLRPHIVSNADASALESACHKAEAYCLVSRAVGSNIKKTVEPRIEG